MVVLCSNPLLTLSAESDYLIHCSGQDWIFLTNFWKVLSPCLAVTFSYPSPPPPSPPLPLKTEELKSERPHYIVVNFKFNQDLKDND